jgi:hypothetical protein
VSSGLILTRADLARGAAVCQVGIRAGERRYALEAMLSQDVSRVLEWLAVEGRAWSRRHVELAAVVGEPVADRWSARAGQTAITLDELAETAWEATACPG